MKKQHGTERVWCSNVVYSASAGKKGRGIFAAKNIKKGTVIEECEVIYIPKKEIPAISKTIIDHYCYRWKGGGMVLTLGFGALYNHSSHENAEWKDDYEHRRMVLWARKDIKKDEEVTVHYHLTRKELWFPVVEDKLKKKK